MRSSMSVARATATLPRNWSKGSLYASADSGSTHDIQKKRQEGANKTRLVLQKYLKHGLNPSADTVDNSNVLVDGPGSISAGPARSISSKRLARVLTASDGQYFESSFDHREEKPTRESSRDEQHRRRLLNKQTKRQSITPAFFDPGTADHALRTSDSLSSGLATMGGGKKLKLTAAALSAHDDPAAAFLAAPSSSFLHPSIDDDVGGKSLRRCASFNAVELPRINVIKAIPDCLEDHSNPSSRDPFYYDRVLKKVESRERMMRIRKQESMEWTQGSTSGVSVGSGGVTAWVVEQYS